jgi:hypothetical protein
MGGYILALKDGLGFFFFFTTWTGMKKKDVLDPKPCGLLVEMGGITNCLPRLASNLNPPHLCLLSSWNY